MISFQLLQTVGTIPAVGIPTTKQVEWPKPQYSTRSPDTRRFNFRTLFRGAEVNIVAMPIYEPLRY